MITHRSCNEVRSTLIKACHAAGYPTGLATDIAEAALLLCAYGYDGIAAVLKSIRHTMPAATLPVQQGDTLCYSTTNAAAVTMAAAEFLYADHESGSTKAIVFNKIDSPLLLAGLVGLAAKNYHCAYTLTLENNSIDIGATKDILPAVGIADTAQCSGTLIMYDAACGKISTPFINGLEVNDKQWREVELLAMQTYVAVSEQSRQGAGAGQIDND